MKATALACLLCGLAAASASATTWHINPDGTGDAPTVQAGIDSAAVGDTVLVACGTYYEHGILMRAGVVLRGPPGMGDCVTIDAEGLGRVMSLLDAGPSTLISGINFIHGAAAWGAGLELLFSDPTITGCGFLENHSDGGFGGGLYIYESSPLLIECRFVSNTALGGGGAYFDYACFPDLRGCVFMDNTAGTYYLHSGGAAIHSVDSHPVLTRCTFAANFSERSSVFFGLDATISRSVIAFNHGSIPFLYGTGFVFSCTNIFGNDHGDWTSNIFDQLGQSGNFTANPFFCGLAAGDLHIHSDSPCTSDNSGGCGLIGALPVGCGPVTSAPRSLTAASWATIKAGYR